MSKLTNQTLFGARRKRPRPLRSPFHATSPDAIVYVILLQPGALWRSMKIKAPFLTAATINIFPIAIVACAIFVVDTQIHVDIDVPVLYVAVVLMSTRLFEGRGILIVSVGCAVLTVAGYLLSPGNLSTTISIANR